MAIFAPKTPQYQSRAQVTSFPGVYADLRPSAAKARAITNLGNMLATRASQMQQERDAAVVGDLYNSWRDESRKKLSELFSTKGKDAVNLDQAYDEFFYESMGKLHSEFENGAQQAAFQEQLMRKREQHLDSLAIYQAKEGQRYKQEVVDTDLVGREESVREAGFKDALVESEINDHIKLIQNTNPQKDTTLLEKKAVASLRFANMQERINIDPSAALETLEKEEWKRDLGEGYYTLKNKAESESKKQLIGNIRNELNAKHTDGIEPDFDAMENDISNSDYSEDVKNSVVVWIRSQEAEYNKRQRERKDETQDLEMDGIFAHIRSGNYPEAYQAVLEASELSETQKFRIEEIIKSASRPESEQFKTNSSEFMEASKAAHTNAISRDEIISNIGVLWDDKDGQLLLNKLKESQKPENDAINKAIKEAEDAITKQIRRGSPLSGYTQESEDDAYRAVKEFNKLIADPPEGATIFDMVDPDSPHYVLNKIVQGYTPTFEEEINRMIPFNTDEGAVRRKQNETLEQYENRLGK
jgi:hypothetical protein